MKNILRGLVSLILLLWFGVAKSQVQTITYTPMTAGGYQYKYLKADSGFNVPNRDTTTGRGTVRGGSIVFDTTARIFYGWNGVKWSPFGSGTGGGSIDSITIVNNNFCIYIGGVPSCITLTPDTIYVKDDLYVTIDSAGHQVIGRLHDDGLVSGGIVTKSGCWSIDVTSVEYYFSNVHFLIGQTLDLPVDTADASFPRIDMVIVDTLGIVSVLKGVPSVTPVAPQINPSSQLALTTIYISAGAACLEIGSGVIYDENIEWTTGHTGAMTVDYNNTDNPYHLTKAGFVSKYVDGAALTFTDAATDTVHSGDILKMFIYTNGPFLRQDGMTRGFQFQFFNGSTAVSSRIRFERGFGFANLDSNRYQLISIPLTYFTFSNPVFDKLVITMEGTDTSGAAGYYIDYVQLQTNLPQQTKTYVDSVTVIAGSDYYWKNGVRTLIGVRSTGTGTGHVYAGYGLTNVNDSTLRADTTLLLTKLGAAAIYQPIINLTTTGTSGAATLIGSTLNVPVYSGGAAATQTLDQTLRIGNITKQKYIVDDSVATAGGSGLYHFELKPQNYGTAYPGFGTSASFSQGYGYYPGVNASGRPNVVGLMWGYNGGFNTPLIAGEPTWGFRTETWYEMGGGIGHTEIHLPEFRSTNGVSRRLLSFYPANTTGSTLTTSQADSWLWYQGATDTTMLSIDGSNALFGYRGNGTVTFQNTRIPTNTYSAALLNNGVTFSIGGGTNPAVSYFNFASPIFITTHASIGTSNSTAVQANVTISGASAYTIGQNGILSGNITGIYGDINTSGLFSVMDVRNIGTGNTQAMLKTNNTGTVQFRLYDFGNGNNWNIALKGSSNEGSLRIGPDNDSSLLIRQTGVAKFKYSLGIGTAMPTARIHIAAGTATANTAPLKFTTASAALLTTPEVGAMEVLVDTLYWTGANGTRNKVFPGAGAVTSIATASPITGGTITSTGTIGIDTTIVATRAYANNVIAGGGAFVALAGNTPLTGNWDAGAFSITSSKTAATAATVYDAFIGTNTTTASSGNQMYGKAIHSIGQGWKTTATAASQSVDNRWYTVPVEGTAAPTGNFVMDQSIAGGAYATIMKVAPTATGSSGAGDFELFNQFRIRTLASNGTRYGNIGGAAGFWHQFMDNNFATTLAQIGNTAAGGNYFQNVTRFGSSTAATSTVSITGSFARAYVAKSSSYTTTISDDVVEVTATGQTITLPTAVSITGRLYTIKLTASGSCTVATTSSQTIDGSTTYSLSAQYKYVTVQSNGANWIIIANN